MGFRAGSSPVFYRLLTPPGQSRRLFANRRNSKMASANCPANESRGILTLRLEPHLYLGGEGRFVPGVRRHVDPSSPVIIDPRAGHGPDIGGFKDDSQVGVALRAGHPVYFVIFFREPCCRRRSQRRCQRSLPLIPMYPESMMCAKTAEFARRSGATVSEAQGVIEHASRSLMEVGLTPTMSIPTISKERKGSVSS